MTTTEPSDQQPEGLLAPWWHTALMVTVILALSLAGVKQLRNLGNQPLHLTANYVLTIAYEWILAALVLWACTCAAFRCGNF